MVFRRLPISYTRASSSSAGGRSLSVTGLSALDYVKNRPSLPCSVGMSVPELARRDFVSAVTADVSRTFSWFSRSLTAARYFHSGVHCFVRASGSCAHTGCICSLEADCFIFDFHLQAYEFVFGLQTSRSSWTGSCGSLSVPCSTGGEGDGRGIRALVGDAAELALCCTVRLTPRVGCLFKH